MQEQRLFRLAPAAILIHAVYDVPDGWRLRVVMRRQDEAWGEATETAYFRLTSEELADVISCEAFGLLRDL